MPTQRERNDFLNAYADAEIAKQERHTIAVNALRAAVLLARKLEAREVTRVEYDRQLATIRQVDTDVILTDEDTDFIDSD